MQDFPIPQEEPNPTYAKDASCRNVCISLFFYIRTILYPYDFISVRFYIRTILYPYDLMLTSKTN